MSNYSIYALRESPDPREYSLALTMAAKKAPAPDAQTLLAQSLIRAVEEIRERQRRSWIRAFPNEPWIPELIQADCYLSQAQGIWEDTSTKADEAHQQRIAQYAEDFAERGHPGRV